MRNWCCTAIINVPVNGFLQIKWPYRAIFLKKVLLFILWDCGGLIHFELLKPGETVTADLDQQLDRVRNELLVKRPVLVN